MSIIEIILIAISLSADAFAIAICKGLSTPNIKIKNGITTGLYFGLAQAIMPVIGFFLGFYFKEYIKAFDHWIAFFLLGIIGFNMIRGSFKKDENEEESCDNQFSFKSLFPLAIATSIDALAVGITFAFLGVNIAFSASMIGIITFTLSFIGVFIGAKFGLKFKSKAEFIGGLALMIIGTKILIEHLIAG